MNSTAEALRDWWSSLGERPRPLTRGESIAFWIVTALAAVSRFPALSKTAWDWDESHFMSAMRSYDVTIHHPHPPGFPLYIGAAKLFALCGLSSFHSLQVVVLLTALAIVPVLFLMGREARFTPEVSLSAAALYAFLPNVWVYGGTAFSDIPSVVLVALAIALLLRGCRSDFALILGGLLFGISMAFRPQNLLIGAAAAAIALVSCIRGGRTWQAVVAAAVAILTVAASYGAAALLSHGLSAYLAAVREHSAYIARIDSFHNPLRTPLVPFLGDLFALPFRAPAINVVTTALTALGLITAFVRRRVPSWLLIVSFAPFFFGAWLYLDVWSLSRFAVAYMPVYAFLIADTLSSIPVPVPRMIVTAIVAMMIVWTWPILRELRKHPSPPAAAAMWIRQNEPPAGITVWTHAYVLPQMTVFLPDFRVVGTGNGGPPMTARPGDVYVGEGVLDDGIVFARRRTRLEGVVRDRYFEVSVVPIERYVTYGFGWYPEEQAGKTTWRWMGNRARIELPGLGRPGVLALDLHVPLDAFPAAPWIEIDVNGSAIDRFQPKTSDLKLRYEIGSAATRNRIDISTSSVFKARGDPRLLGIRLNRLQWLGMSVPHGAPAAARRAG